jgi:DNA helicase HerA-like ATPase
VGNAEELTKAFYAWELRGRGWQSYDYPVSLEPVFRPFPGHVIGRPSANDGRRETRLSGLIGRFLGKTNETPPEDPEPPEPDPEPFEDEAPLREIRVTLPEKVSVSPALSAQLLLALSPSRFPLAFEVLGLPDSLRPQITVRLPDRDRVMGQLRAFFPDILLAEDGEGLRPAWRGIAGEGTVREFGLAREFMLPLGASRDFRPDPLLSLFAGLALVREGELACFQVLFEPVRSPWAEHMLRAVTTDQGEPFLLDAPEVTTLAKEKAAQPLYAVIVRLAAKAPDAERTWEILRSAAGGLNAFASWNELLPLSLDEEIDLDADLLGRTTHRAGMLLGQDELAGLVHLPHESVRLAKLRREVARTKGAPPSVFREGIALGTNAHDGRRVEVRLPRDLRMRHVHVVGASGSGKSTLLTRMILDDLARGEGVGVLDPHGDLVDEILARFPRERESDLILFDPSDDETALGWNMLEARTEIEKTLLASDLVGVFRRLSTSWGDQMNSVLANAIVAFLESNRGGTLLELRRFLVDREFRAEFLTTVSDSEVLYYWQKEFPILVGKPQGPILTRLDTFLRPKLVRQVVVERENRLDFRGMVDRGQVFLAKLSQGALGEENASLLGSLLVSAFHQAAISRQDLAPGARRHFFLYLDEFHEFATPSMAALLTGARKYRLGLTLAHQELRQLEAKNREVASALLGNAATRIVFRVGEDDAKSLERGFSSFSAADLLNLGVGEAVMRVERSEHDFNLETMPLPDLVSHEAEARQRKLVAQSRARFPKRLEAPGAEPLPPAPLPPREAPQASTSPRLVVSPPPKNAPRPAEPPPPLGRGGPEHQYLQDLVKRWAESHGYRAVVEEAIPGGKGSVDVALRTDDFSIACEISVTSTVAQEVGNVLKCLEAGFHEIAILSLKRPRLTKIEAALTAKFSAADLARVHLVSPEELFAMLSMRPVTTETVVGGYKVKVRQKVVEPDEEAARYRALSEVIAKSVRRMGAGEKK